MGSCDSPEDMAGDNCHGTVESGNIGIEKYSYKSAFMQNKVKSLPFKAFGEHDKSYESYKHHNGRYAHNEQQNSFDFPLTADIAFFGVKSVYLKEIDSHEVDDNQIIG